MKKILTLGSLIFLIASCHKEGLPVSNSARNDLRRPLPGLPPVPAPPTLTVATGVFNFFSQSSYPVREYTTRSRYVLNNDSTFALHYDDNGGFDYRGTYTKMNDIITFNWEGWSTAGPWGATGIIRGDTLTVSYNIIMMLSDFEDAVYLRKPQ